MHRLMRERLEETVAGSPDDIALQHLENCEECRTEVAALREQAAVMHALRAPSSAEPRAGFYARVMERIEAQGPVSIWNLFFDSIYGRRLAYASLALALLMGVYLVSSEFSADDAIVVADDVVQQVQGVDQPAPVVSETAEARPAGQAQPADGFGGIDFPGIDEPGVVLGGAPDPDAVLVNLVTYHEQ